MYIVDDVYKSLIYTVRTFAPSGVVVVSGENYGIRFDDPTGKNPSIAVNLEDISDLAIELGSGGAQFVCSLTINAKSRLQRDALKSIIFNNISNSAVPIYADADNNDFTVIKYAEVRPGMKMRDMPNFNDGREAFYWTATVFFTIELI